MSRDTFIDEEIIGGGTYGVVIKGTYNGEVCALKKCYRLKSLILGCYNLRELDILTRISRFPHTVNMKMFIFSDNTEHAGRQCEPIQFIMEYYEVNGVEFLRNRNLCTPQVARKLSHDLLLGLAYIHSKKIVHRDIKPDNALVKRESDGTFRLAITDVGLSQFLCHSSPSTPGVNTAWYRSPEVCLDFEYGSRSDVWSAGASIYEFFTGEYLMYTTNTQEERGSEILKRMVNVVPIPIEEETLQHYERILNNEAKVKRLREKFKRESEPVPFIDRFRRLPNFRSMSTSEWLSLINLLEQTLHFHQNKRISSFESVRHEFFLPFKRYTEKIHEKYFYGARLPHIVFKRTKEFQAEIKAKFLELRDEFFNKKELFRIKNKQTFTDGDKFNIYRILFHAVDLFYRYCTHFKINEVSSNKLDFLVRESIYFFTKYFDTFGQIHRFHFYFDLPQNIDPERVVELERKILLFEKDILTKIIPSCNFHEFTPYECVDCHMREGISLTDMAYLFEHFLDYEQWKEGSYRRMFRKIMKIPEEGE